MTSKPSVMAWLGRVTVLLLATPALGGIGSGHSAVGILDTLPPEVAIQKPVEHEVVTAGTVYDFRWTLSELYPGGPTDHTAYILFNNLVYDSLPFLPFGEPGYVWYWTVPDTTLANCRLKIVATDGYGNLTEVISERITLLSSTTPVLPETPRATALRPPYPNPFNPQTKISFSLRNDAEIDLRVYDVHGRQVRRLAGGHRLAGNHWVTWNGLDDRARRAPAGLYLVRMQYHDVATTGSLVQKVVMLP